MKYLAGLLTVGAFCVKKIINTGELARQAERKQSASTLKPDADNAAVGNHRSDFTETLHHGVSCFYA